MSEPIIIETPAPPTRERLVLVPIAGTTRERQAADPAAWRDATPDDLERGGWVKRDRYDNAQERVDQFAAEIGQLRDRAALAEAHRYSETGTLAHLRNDLRDAVNERDDLRHHYDAAGPEHNLLALLDSYESDADTARAQASAAYAMVVAAIGSVGAETIEAAVARLVADRGALLTRAEKAEAAAKAGYARHIDTLTRIREAIGAPDNADTAVADRAREERPECLVAQAVAANVDIRVAEDDGGGFMVGVHESGCDEELARCVPAADVPATLARLLGEVSR